MIDVECVVIGGGVVGLAVTRALAMVGRETLLVERHPTVGCETSSRNSEVIHAGLYYPQGSLKATTCVRGNALLYAYCETAGVPYRKCGKLIVATDESQVAKLHAIREAAGRNGVLGMAMLSAEKARSMEAQLECVAALHSPATGIVDSHAFMLSLLGDAENHGATCAFRSSVERLSINGHGIHVWTDAAGTTPLACRWLINCAGLDAVSVARRIEGFPAQHIPQAFLAKGSYFCLAVRAPFSRLVYPVPEPGGLGVHLTLDQAGRARFGPDVQWVETVDYDVDPARSAGFYGAIRKYWPGLPDGALEPAYAGMRPKITGPGDAAGDFRIDGPAVHGVPGVINLFGIESPGLTASLAIAEHVVQLVAE